tara:strand:+ start:113 stop:961 length:849 start_codon:yes stop_codon:yes gene_type:complete
MTKLKSLELKYDQLDQELKALETRQSRLYHRGNKQKAVMLENSFKMFSHHLFQLNVSETRVRLHPNDDKYNDIVEYTLETNWRRSDEGERIEKSRMYHNGQYHYSNVDKSQSSNFDDAIVQSEARLEFLRLATANDGNIKFRWEAIDAKYSKYDISFYEPMRKLRDKIRKVTSEISKIEQDAEMKTLENEGISFQTTEKRGYLPSLNVRFDHEVNRIKNIRVVGKTETGKSVDLQITRAGDRWNEEAQAYDKIELVDVYAKVRLSKVKTLVRSARLNGYIKA